MWIAIINLRVIHYFYLIHNSHFSMLLWIISNSTFESHSFFLMALAWSFKFSSEMSVNPLKIPDVMHSVLVFSYKLKIKMLLKFYRKKKKITGKNDLSTLS